MLSHQTILFGLGKEKHLHIKNTLYLSSNFLKLSSITLLWLIIDKTVVGHLGNVSMHACFRYSFLCTMIHKRDSTSAFMLMFSSIKEAIIFFTNGEAHGNEERYSVTIHKAASKPKESVGVEWFLEPLNIRTKRVTLYLSSYLSSWKTLPWNFVAR